MADQTRLCVTAEYECFPIWREDPDGVTNIAPEDLRLPDFLVSELNSWALRFEETFDSCDPLSSGFADPATEDEFYARGRELARQLADVLGDEVEVRFCDGRTGESRLV